MKKITIIQLAVSLLCAGYIQTAVAQVDTMKTLEPVVIYAKSNVNKAVTDAFDKHFKDAMDPQWFRMNKDFLVTFITGDMKNNALFRKNGKMVYHVSYGQDHNLPDELKTQVQNGYPDYNITRVVNVKMDNRDVWVVNLEGLKKWIIVRMEDGELEEVENYDKAS
ncbi:MAG TPA: hypothetical protein VFQ73_10135 [Flavisolibacter sp.]|nr:hypothetical protein [Flavisolibacter sp.]